MTHVLFQGLDAVAVLAPDGARAVVTLHGGHVVSWVPAGGDEQLYLSPRSAFAAGQAIRGGVPVVFPQFSNRGPLPRHGFARVAPWQLVREAIDGGDALAVLRLGDDARSRAVWPHAFALELVLRVAGRRLSLALACSNTGDAPLQFAAALHTYLRVADIAEVRVTGLNGAAYLDAMDGIDKRQGEEPLRIDGEVDRVYQAVARPLHLYDGRDGAAARRCEVSQQGFEEVVVWNPGAQKCAALADMPEDGWRHMLCIEAARIARPVILAPGERWEGRQVLQYLAPDAP